MRRMLWLCLLTGAVALDLSPVARAAALDDLVAGGIEKVVGDCKFTEGPAWHPDGYLLFSDIPNSRIIRVLPDGSHSDWLKPSGGANGLMCDQDGNVYAAQGDEQRVARLRSGVTGGGVVAATLAETFDGQPFNKPNDLALDADGGLYFTDPNYRREPASQPVEGVYYVSRAGETARVVADLPRPNGILVSPDGKTLYVANINRRQIMAYEIVAPGRLSAGKTLFTGDEQLDGNGPDGMALDADGRIYATYKQLVVLERDGGLIGRVAVPEKPANCAFGGTDNRTLYITAQTSLYKLPMKVSGMKLQAQGPLGPKSVSWSRAPAAGSYSGGAQFVYFEDKPAAQGEKPAAPGEKPAAVDTVKVELQGLTLHALKSWEQQKPTSNLRLGQFSIPPVEGDAEPSELAIFPPFGGTVQQNVERWVTQFEGQGRQMTAKQGTCPAGKYVLVDLSGTYKKPFGPPFLQQTKPAENYRMLGVILSVTDGGNYFLKLTGPKATVASAADPFRKSFGGDASQETDYAFGDQ